MLSALHDDAVGQDITDTGDSDLVRSGRSYCCMPERRHVFPSVGGLIVCCRVARGSISALSNRCNLPFVVPCLSPASI
jgi:hypothetical protein